MDPDARRKVKGLVVTGELNEPASAELLSGTKYSSESQRPSETHKCRYFVWFHGLYASVPDVVLDSERNMPSNLSHSDKVPYLDPWRGQ